MAASMCGRVDKISSAFRVILSHSVRYSSSAVQQCTDDSPIDLYPPVKPKFPPGKWGAMDRGDAWYWQMNRDKMSKLTTIKERLDFIGEKERIMWRYKVMENYPRILTYQQYATKTHMIKGLPQVYNDLNVDLTVQRIKSVIEDVLLIERDSMLRNKILSKIGAWNKQYFQSHLTVKALLENLLMCCCESGDHLLRSQVDEKVAVKATWDRRGYMHVRNLPKLKGSLQKIDLMGQEGVTSAKMVHFAKLQADHVASFVVRTEEPLPEFLPQDHELCLTGSYPPMEYHAPTYGQILMPKTKPSVVAGHWHGDPCEFTQLTVEVCNRLYTLGEQYGETCKEQLILGAGMNSSFVRTVAEAHYQGFNTYLDISYPFTTQTIVSDGQRFQFFAYQLNTLEMWKDDEGNPVRNICWHTDEMKLYDTVEDGKVNGFNEDVLKMIVKFLLLSPGRPGVQLRPDVIQEPPVPKDSVQYINEKIDTKPKKWKK